MAFYGCGGSFLRDGAAGGDGAAGRLVVVLGAGLLRRAVLVLGVLLLVQEPRVGPLPAGFHPRHLLVDGRLRAGGGLPARSALRKRKKTNHRVKLRDSSLSVSWGVVLSLCCSSSTPRHLFFCACCSTKTSEVWPRGGGKKRGATGCVFPPTAESTTESSESCGFCGELKRKWMARCQVAAATPRDRSVVLLSVVVVLVYELC